MTYNWPLIAIDEVKAPTKASIAMGPFGSDIKTDNFVDSGVPVIRGVNLAADRRFTDDGFVYLTDEKADELKAANAFPGDLVFTHRGTLGQVGIIPDNSKYPRYVVSQSQMKLTCDTKKINPLFLYYFFQSPQGQHALLANTSTTGVPAISRPLTSLKSIQVPFPSKKMQDAIASILGSLDDTIDLNRRMNETLEAMARAIFQSWFVDFDPVHAKVEGRQPWGMNAETTALFPSSCEETVDHIPANWTAGRLDSIATNPRSSISPQNIPSGTPYIGLEHMPRKSIALTEWELADGVESNKYQFKQGEYLFGKLRPYFHKVGIAPVSGVCSTDILVVVPKEPCWAAFVLMCISSDDFVAHTDRTSAGTKMPRTNWADMGMYEVTLPPKAIAEKFNQITMPMFEKIISNIHQSNTLADLRDTLLPKLIAGEILIKEAEQKIEEEIA